jgi:arylsulfatase A-like enzyme
VLTNLIVYVSDALRTDHLGCYGARYVSTPTIDEFARGAVLFEQAIATAPWTCPSTASMITGLYPHRHRYLHWDSELDPGFPTLFTVASAFGYETASFVFDESYLFKGFTDANVVGTTEKLDGVVEWLRARGHRKHGDRPFCLWFHSWATHMPYDVLHSERGEWLAAKEEIITGIQSDSASALDSLREGYRRAVEHQSEVLFASFLEALDDLGLRERTALAFVADHGESWGERFANKEDVKGTYHLHGAGLYDEVVEVPLILAAPGHLDPGVVPSQVSLVDLMPTLADLGGAPIDGLDGTSLLPLAEGLEQEDRVAVIVGTDKGAVSQLAVRLPPWKLIRRVESGDEEGYQLDLDPRELHSRPEDVPDELRARLRDELAASPTETLSADEEALVERRLADLGYL